MASDGESGQGGGPGLGSQALRELGQATTSFGRLNAPWKPPGLIIVCSVNVKISRQAAFPSTRCIPAACQAMRTLVCRTATEQAMRLLLSKCRERLQTPIPSPNVIAKRHQIHYINQLSCAWHCQGVM